ncbi:hypothetical protein [Cellulomonas sp. URHD0024]|uniref:hypothetical protein n=1 Tax=Cellulomonas sp. URHD0024 TaxID=1302620 RepID=UPI00040B7DAD|nr:hypothetical protein [Cellulomonas sp. URHD0024]
MTETVPTPEPALVQIGDIVVSEHWVVTPNGTAPLAGSQWSVRDATVRTQVIPTYAIVLAIVFALACLLGLLFLLIKEDKVTGFVEVTVRSGSLAHLTQIPVPGPAADVVADQVRYAQQLAAR